MIKIRELAVTLGLDTTTVPFFNVAFPAVKVALGDGLLICDKRTSVPLWSGNVYVLLPVIGVANITTLPVAEGKLMLLLPSKVRGTDANGFMGW